MAQKTCRVTIPDTDGVEHTAHVNADSLYEAVARGLAALKANSWTGDLVEGQARVMVQDTPVEHNVRLREFHSWIAKAGGSPRDITQRQKLREILAKR